MCVKQLVELLSVLPQLGHVFFGLIEPNESEFDSETFESVSI
jgi:hypothetical protein